LGRGPVDFKFSQGYSKRLHLEVKKLHNGKFWNGLSEQLPSYMKSDEVTNGWFLAVQYRSNKSSQQRIKDLPRRVSEVATKRQITLLCELVDAQPKVSASSL